MIIKLKLIERKASSKDLAKKKRLLAKNINVNWNTDSVFINNCSTQFNRNVVYKTNVYQ